MTYDFAYLQDDVKLDILKMHIGSNEADLYDFQVKLSELNMATIKDEEVIAEYEARINDKIEQNNMLNGLITDLMNNMS